jgi:phosphopantothenoylcysteine synthetase/decarboxylase
MQTTSGSARAELPRNPRVLVGATGSSAVSMLPTYLNALRERFGGTYTVLMTHTATTFIPPHTVRLSAERVVADESPADWPTDKPSRLAADHDIMLVLPATANILSAAATGAAPNRLATVILAVPYPVVFFPHMGTAMWEKPAVRRNVAQVRADGYHVVEPVWHEGYDVTSGTVTSHPAVPSPPDVVKAVEVFMGA